MEDEFSQLRESLGMREESITVMIAKIILNKCNTFICNDWLYCYREGVYNNFSQKSFLAELEFILPEEIRDKLKIKERQDIVSLVFIKSKIIESIPKYKNYLNVQNGVYDVINDKLLPHDPKYLFTYKLSVRFERYAKCEKFKMAVEKAMVGDILWGMHLQDYMGYAISDYPLKKEFVLFLGESNTSKSVFAGILRNIIGNQYVDAVDMKNLNNEYYLSRMCSKRFNTCSDMGSTELKDLSLLKQLTSMDDAITVRSIRQSPKMIMEKPKMLFATNHYPKIISETENLMAFFNRVHIIPFKYIVPKEDQIENYADILFKEEGEGILLWLIEGYRRFLVNDGNFTECKAVKKAKRKYENYYMLPFQFVEKCIKFKPEEKVFTQELEKALVDFSKEKKSKYRPEYMVQVRSILRAKGIENKKVRKKNKTKQGFYGIQLCMPEKHWYEL